MEEISNTVSSHDNGRYDNDFEKLPRDEEEISDPQTGPVSPGGDGKYAVSATTGDEDAPSPGKSQLNVEETSITKPQPVTCDVGGDKGAVCSTSCES